MPVCVFVIFRVVLCATLYLTFLEPCVLVCHIDPSLLASGLCERCILTTLWFCYELRDEYRYVVRDLKRC